MKYQKRYDLLAGRAVWVLELQNQFNPGKALLLSKVSEAIRPNTEGNHQGDGSCLAEFLAAQPGVRFVVNGGFNHYRKNFYHWSHQNYQVGDPVGRVKIRHHYFEDILDDSCYGYFVQKEKGQPWAIVGRPGLSKDFKYILGCTPLLIWEGTPCFLPSSLMAPMPEGVVNPPSVLGHGGQRHPRTAVGIKDSILYFLVVEGGSSQGCTLKELQSIGVKLELTSLLNLDGGGSSQFRLRTNQGWVGNFIEPQDKNRVLGNVIALFEDALKTVPLNTDFMVGVSGPLVQPSIALTDSYT